MQVERMLNFICIQNILIYWFRYQQIYLTLVLYVLKGVVVMALACQAKVFW